ncbi:MAG: hypothetical protein QXI33_02085 [Candidatus Pacearchaeota archaeon]
MVENIVKYEPVKKIYDENKVSEWYKTDNYSLTPEQYYLSRKMLRHRDAMRGIKRFRI